MDFQKKALSAVLAVVGTVFLGYCIYFDNKRRKDPDYKRKVRERRRHQRKMEMDAMKTVKPDLNDSEALEKYFLQEIQLGEALIEKGDYIMGVEHLYNAISVCGQPARLLQTLEAIMPPEVSRLLVKKVQRLTSGNDNKRTVDIDSTTKSESVINRKVQDVDDLE